MNGEKSAIRSYSDLRVWREAMDLAVAAYEPTQEFASREQHGLTAQIRRAAASIAAKIAEGYGRESRGAYVQSLHIAQGSLKELETHVLLSERVKLSSVAAGALIMQRCDTVGRMLHGLIRSL